MTTDVLAPVSLSTTLDDADYVISLAGEWNCGLERYDNAVGEAWFRNVPASYKVHLPGSLPKQGIGDPPTTETRWTGSIFDPSWFISPEYEKSRQAGNVKIPFWLQPNLYYKGPAWYQREVEIPESWQGRRIILMLERPHWETRVWFDDREIGTRNSLSVPHEYDLGVKLPPGAHRVTIRVDNRMVIDVGVNSHSITDHTQGNWNGIVGRIELRATPLVWIEDVQVFPNLAAKTVTVKGRIGNVTGERGRDTANITIESTSQRRLTSRPTQSVILPVSWNIAGGAFETTVAPANDACEVKVWDEFNPELYRLIVTLAASKASSSVTFGMRDISTVGTQFTINGRRTYLRGTLECCIFPKTGHPPTDVDSWKRIIRIAKAHGLNHLRFHSWCPPEAAFRAGDELGMYFQIECGSWANQGATIGDGKPLDRWIYEEADRILKAYGNHPCFVLMAYGNEPDGAAHKAFLGDWVKHYKAIDSRRLYSSAAGWPEVEENQFHVTHTPRLHQWGDGLKSRINARPPETRTDYRDFITNHAIPVISHEIGQWCAYPNFEEIPKYTGYLKPKNFEIFRDSLEAHHMGDQAHDFLIASGRLQALCYKEEVEAALRTPGMGGFQLLGLNDFPGQGTAPVGVLDSFWEEKGYITAGEYRRFCNSTVPLARLTKRVFTTDESLEEDVEVAHFGAAPIEDAVIHWELTGKNGIKVAGGNLPSRVIPVDNGTSLGRVSVELKDLKAPARYKLLVTVSSQSGPIHENDWDLWVYPPKSDVAVSREVRLVTELNDETVAWLKTGGKVLLNIPAARLKGDKLGQVALGFSSIFWNTAWTNRQAPHTLGIVCEPKHAALSLFPTESHSDWQWWYLLKHAGAMILDELPVALRPIVQVIDDWVTNRKIGLVFEARIGAGKLLVTSIDVTRDDNPVSRQMLHSLLHYTMADRFQPPIEVSADQVRRLYVAP